jgi:hypothetical protein
MGREDGFDKPAKEELVGDNFGGVDHGIEELGDIASLVAFPFRVRRMRGRGIVVAVSENVELFDEAIIGMYLWSSCRKRWLRNRKMNS